MNIQKHRSFGVRLLASLASVLAVGATNASAKPVPGAALSNIMEHAAEPFGDFRNHPNGRKAWGMSAACHNMRKRNVQRGYVEHFRPRASK